MREGGREGWRREGGKETERGRREEEGEEEEEWNVEVNRHKMIICFMFVFTLLISQ